MAGEFHEGTVTVLFTDVEASSEIGSRSGDRTAHGLLKAHSELLRSHVGAHGGREIKSLGDGLMVAFTSARRAVTCAVAIQRALDALRRSQPEAFLPVRMGLNAGEAIHEGGDLFGAAVVAAARITHHARGQQILASEVVKALVGTVPDVTFREAGAFELRGFGEPWKLFEIVWRRDDGGPRSGARTPLVGREKERAEMRRRLDDLERGVGGLVLIGGEPGVGKTRLAEEVALTARQRGFRTLVGRCYDLDSPSPYLPFLELLEDALKKVDRDTFRLALADSGGEIAKVMPQLRNLFDDLPPGLELPAEQERRYLFNSIGEFVARAASARPVVAVLDDLHWADESSVLLLQSIAARLPSLPVLVIGTYRNVELDVYRPFGRGLDNLVRQRLAHRMSLKRFSQEGTRMMLERLAGEPPPAPVARVIHRETDGNPFFVEEVFRHLSEEGHLFDDEGRWRGELETDGAGVPESVRLVIGRRLRGVGEATLKALGAAAVIGRTFDYDVLEALGEVEPDALLDAVEEAQGLSLVRCLSDDPAETRFEFVHELIRQTLLGGMSLPRRRRLHARVARAIESVHLGALDERAPEIAGHLLRAGGEDRPMTMRYLLHAGRRAQESAAFEDALRYHEEAMNAADPTDDAQVARIEVGLARAFRSLGRADEAMQNWRAALDVFERVGDVDAVAEIASEMVLHLGWAGDWAAVLETAARVLGVIGERDIPERILLLNFAGIALGWAGQYELSTQMVDEAVELARRTGDRELLGQGLTGKSLHAFAYAFTDRCVRAGAEACALLRGTKSQWQYATALAFLSVGLASTGRYDEVAPVADELTVLAHRLGFGGGVMFAHRARMIAIHARAGDIASAERAGYEDLEICERYNLPWIGQSHFFISMAKFHAGDLEAAAEEARRGIELDQPSVLTGWGEGQLFRALCYLGRTAEALAVYEAAAALLPEPGTVNAYGRWNVLGYVVEGWYVLGEWERAADLAAAARQAATLEAPFTFDGRTFSCVAGIAATAAGEYDDAEVFFERVLDMGTRAHLIEVLDVKRFFGSMLLTRGDPADRERASVLLREAVEGFDALRMPVHASLAREWLARRSAARTSSSYRSG